MLQTLNDPTFQRKPEMIRALVPACVSLQIPVKMGMKLVAQTAALFWSVDHVFCNFEVGIDPFSAKFIIAFCVAFLDPTLAVVCFCWSDICALALHVFISPFLPIYFLEFASPTCLVDTVLTFQPSSYHNGSEVSNEKGFPV